MRWVHFLLCVAIAGLGAGAANMVVQNFVLKDDESDTTGFILKKPGIGLDDAISALGMGIGAYVALKLTKHTG